MSTQRKPHKGITTRAIHAGYQPDSLDGAIIPPIQLSTTFRLGSANGFEYSRAANPTRHALEQTMAALDDATWALAYSSGSAALANIVSLLGEGEEILFSSDAYGGTYRYIARVFGERGGKYHTADLTDLRAAEAILRDHPVKIVWVETPTNPLLKVTDIEALAVIAHRHKTILVVDNTFATPVIQKPLALGADIVVYSTTKYMNGHSDSIGGSLALSDEKLYEKLKFLQNAIGAILSPFDSWLTLRGLRTLELRMQRHVENARLLAKLLEAHPKVKKVYFPGLFDGEQERIVAKQMALPGAVISIELDPQYDVQSFLGALRYFPLAESLGGVESLIDHPATMTHASLPPEERAKIGLSDHLLRISVGIENSSDLLHDMEDALTQTTKMKA
jgi:cystathionine beta-lyase/cystathionine gamma-synthase